MKIFLHKFYSKIFKISHKNYFKINNRKIFTIKKTSNHICPSRQTLHSLKELEGKQIYKAHGLYH